MAGHSKWANIQHRKGRQDAARSKLFSKLAKEITVAAKMGDPDPDKNPRLRLAVKEAKGQSVPKDVIERAIKKAIGGDAENYDEIRYEGYGPNGVAVIVETMTDNKNRTASTVRSTFSKNGGNLGETGSVGFMFERKGEVVYPATVGDADDVMMAAIEAGAEDVDSSEDGHIVYCADTDLNDVSNALEAELGESESTKLIWKPTTTTELGLEDMQKLMKLVDALEDDDDVQRVTTNFEASDRLWRSFKVGFSSEIKSRLLGRLFLLALCNHASRKQFISMRIPKGTAVGVEIAVDEALIHQLLLEELLVLQTFNVGFGEWHQLFEIQPIAVETQFCARTKRPVGARHKGQQTAGAAFHCDACIQTILQNAFGEGARFIEVATGAVQSDLTQIAGVGQHRFKFAHHARGHDAIIGQYTAIQGHMYAESFWRGAGF